MDTRKYRVNRPRHKKLRLRKNIKGFRRSEYWLIRCAALRDGYIYPSKYLAER